MRATDDSANRPLFDLTVWGPALEKYGEVAHLSVVLYGRDATISFGPLPRTAIVAAFQAHGHDSGMFTDCARQCLAQPIEQRFPIIVA